MQKFDKSIINDSKSSTLNHGMKNWGRWAILVSWISIIRFLVQKRRIYARIRIRIIWISTSNILKIFRSYIGSAGINRCVRIIVSMDIRQYSWFLSVWKRPRFLPWQRSGTIHVFRMSGAKAILGRSSLCVRLKYWIC